MDFRICSTCGKELPLNKEYFKRNRVNGMDAFHKICKECERENRRTIEWKDGKLLCHKCKEFKEENEFVQNNQNNVLRNYRKNVCRKCDSERQANLDRNLQDDKKLERCLRFRFLGARDRAKKHNVPFDLDLNFVINLWHKQNGLCAISKIPMTFELRMGRVPTNVSIDRINGALGYTKENIQLVCMACNQIKSDLTEDQMYIFCKNIVECYEQKHINFGGKK